MSLPLSLLSSFVCEEESPTSAVSFRTWSRLSNKPPPAGSADELMPPTTPTLMILVNAVVLVSIVKMM